MKHPFSLDKIVIILLSVLTYHTALLPQKNIKEGEKLGSKLLAPLTYSGLCPNHANVYYRKRQKECSTEKLSTRNNHDGLIFH